MAPYSRNTNNEREFWLTRDDGDKRTSVKTGRRNLFLLSKNILIVDLEIDPNQEESVDDIYTLLSTDDARTYRQSKTIKDDHILGDNSLTLVFTDIPGDLSFSLEVDPGEQGESYYVFEDIHYDRLKNKEFTSEEEDLSPDQRDEDERPRFNLDGDSEPDYSSVEYDTGLEDEDESGDDFIDAADMDELDDEKEFSE